MKILVLYILKLIFIAESDSIPSVLCDYPGNIFKLDKNFKFSASVINPRCDALQIGRWDLDDPISDSDPVVQDIACGVESGKPVYIVVSFVGDSQYPAIIDSKNVTTYCKLVTPMLEFIKKNKITGIVLDYLQLTKQIISDYAPKLNSFICKMKETVSTLQVAIVVNGWMTWSFNDKTLFDYSKANEGVDIFIISVLQAGVGCSSDALETGLLPLSSNNENVTALDTVCEGVKNSPMQQDKLMIMYMISVQFKGNTSDATSYSAYCKLKCSNKLDNSTTYCTDNVQMLYNEGKFASNYFKGIALSSIDTDDYDGSCGCGQFVVSNTYIDGFQNKPLTCCDLLS